MKIAIVAAGGKIGKAITNAAVSRGMDVTAIARHEIATNAQHLLVKDLYDLTAADLAGYDAVVDAFGIWDPQQLHQHTTSLMHLADLLSGTNTRLVVVGGAGSLYLDATSETMLFESSGFQPEYLPVATAMANSLAELRKRDDVQWTYISPAAAFEADAPATGNYQFGGEYMIFDAQGNSHISYADYASALVDELEHGSHLRQRISVAAK